MALTQEAAARKDRATGSSTRMEHRHMAFIAEVLKNADVRSLANGASIARRFADALELSNPRFDRARFMTACGLDGVS